VEEWHDLQLTDESYSVISSVMNYRKDSNQSTDFISEGKILLKIQYLSAHNSNGMGMSDVTAGYYQKFLNLLLHPNLALFSALCDAADMAEADKMVPPLVRILNQYSLVHHASKFLIQKEVDLSTSTSVLFRSNSVAIKVISVYAKMIGSDFIVSVLGSLIKEACKISDLTDYEVDPSKVTVGPSLEGNVQRLSTLAQQFVDAIVNSAAKCPLEVREICAQLSDIVSSKYPSFSLQAVASFISLRVLCPAVITPESFKIIKPDNINDTSRRILTLIAKILQNVFNGNMFGQKEKFMQPFNAFIEQNQERAKDFLSNVATHSTSRMTSLNSNDNVNIVVLDEDSSQTFVHTLKTEAILDVMATFKYVVMYQDKILRVNTDDRIRTKVPVTELMIVMDGLQEDTSRASSKFETIPFASYSSKLLKHGFVKIDQESLFDLNWRMQQQTQSLYFEEELDVLNDYPVPDNGRGVDLDLGNLSVQLLRHILQLYIEHHGKWADIRSSSQFARFQQDTAKLQFVNLYSNYPTLLAFWINVFNTMVLHLHVIMGPPTNSFLQKLFLTQYKYRIGCHLFSLADIQDGILRGNPKNRLTRHRQFRGGDYRRALAIPFDNRIHFALSYLMHNSPLIRIYNPDSVDLQLQFAAETYLAQHMQVIPEKGEVILPRMFQKFPYDFGMNTIAQLSVNGKTGGYNNGPLDHEHYRDLLIWLFQFLSTRRRLDVHMLLEKDQWEIKFAENPWKAVNLRETVRNAKKVVLNTVHEIQSSLRFVWTEIAETCSSEVLLDVAASIKSISSKVRTVVLQTTFLQSESSNQSDSFQNMIKDMQPSINNSQQDPKLSPQRSFVIELTADQRKYISESKQQTFLKLLKRVCIEIESINSKLSNIVTQIFDSNDNRALQLFAQNTTLQLTMTDLSKEVKSLEDRLRTHNKNNLLDLSHTSNNNNIQSQSSKSENNMNVFLLLQAMTAELVDILHILKLILDELEILNILGSQNDQQLMLTIALMVRYMKQLLLVDTQQDNPQLPPLELKPEQLVVTPSMVHKLVELKVLSSHTIKESITKQLKQLQSRIAYEPSIKQVLYCATKVRNIRNALRYLKGFKTKGVFMDTSGSNRLSIRILKASQHNQNLQRELAEEDLRALSRALS